jgi:hypothetical protein
MHELGVLGRYLPEFGKLTCLVQHDAFHRFTIDEHTLRSIEYLDAVAASAGSGLRLYRKLFGGLSRPSLLYLGVLLHDVGKPLGADHPTTGAALARRACERLGLSPAETAQVEFLVQHHLLLSHTAFRRDLSDAKVVSDVVETVRTAEALAQLLLLVSADILGTAPELWNEWKEALLWDLYGRCGTRLQRSAHAAATKRLARVRDKVALSLKGVLDERAIGALLEQLPDRLFEIFPLGYLTRLAGLPHELGERAFVSEWAWNKARRVWDVAVCTRDRHGLLACLTGAFAVEEVNILSAHIHTLKGGIVLDVFRVAALAGRTPIDRAFTAGVNRVFDKVLRQGTDVEELLARAQARPGPPGRGALQQHGVGPLHGHRGDGDRPRRPAARHAARAVGLRARHQLGGYLDRAAPGVRRLLRARRQGTQGRRQEAPAHDPRSAARRDPARAAGGQSRVAALSSRSRRRAWAPRCARGRRGWSRRWSRSAGARARRPRRAPCPPCRWRLRGSGLVAGR